jgi:hypothetical protein
MKKKRHFVTLRESANRFDDGDDVELMLDWLVVYGARCDNLYKETNLQAMATRLRRHHDPAAIKILKDARDYCLLLVDPDFPEAIAEAVALNRASQEEHLDDELFIKALDELVQELWSSMELEDRVRWFSRGLIEADDIWNEMCPADLRPELEQLIC